MHALWITAASATLLGLAFATPATSQRLPSDVEQRMGIPPNAANSGRGRYRNPPSNWEQQMRRRSYQGYGHRYDDDYYDRRRYRAYRPAPRYYYD